MVMIINEYVGKEAIKDSCSTNKKKKKKVIKNFSPLKLKKGEEELSNESKDSKD